MLRLLLTALSNCYVKNDCERKAALCMFWRSALPFQRNKDLENFLKYKNQILYPSLRKG